MNPTRILASIQQLSIARRSGRRSRAFAGTFLATLLAFLLTGMASAQTGLTTLHDSLRTATDAANPSGDFVADSKGVLYGVTNGFSNPSRIYSMTPPAVSTGSWTLTVLYIATSNALVRGRLQPLTLGKNGHLYGGSNACAGGTHGCVFQLIPPTVAGGPWTIQIVHLMGMADGGLIQPGLGRLALDAAGNLYGVALGGGLAGHGAVFQLSPPTTAGGAWTENTLFTFSKSPGNMYDPRQNVVLDQKGNLYGSTSGSESAKGQGFSAGPVFRLGRPAVAGGNWTMTALTNVSVGDQHFQPSISQLTVGSSGTLYGVQATFQPFAITPPSWTVTYLPSSPVAILPIPPSYGRELGVDANENLYGADPDSQEVYKLSPPTTPGGAWTRTVLHKFIGGSEGSQPYGRPLVDASGNVFGTTLAGGTGTGCKVNGVAVTGCGTVFELQ